MSSEGQLKGEEVTVEEGLGIAFFTFFLHKKEQLSEEPDLSCPSQLMCSSYSPAAQRVREPAVHAGHCTD